MAKKPVYRLQALFEIREKAKKAAEDLYAEKMRDVAVEEKKLAEMKETLQQMIASREAKKAEYAEKMRTGALNVQQIRANDWHIERLKQEEAAYGVEISRQGEAVREAEDVAEEAKEEMLKASQDFKALEKHKEKWLKKVKRELMLKEEEEVEDIAQAQYFKRLLEAQADEG